MGEKEILRTIQFYLNFTACGQRCFRNKSEEKKKKYRHRRLLTAGSMQISMPLVRRRRFSFAHNIWIRKNSYLQLFFVIAEFGKNGSNEFVVKQLLDFSLAAHEHDRLSAYSTRVSLPELSHTRTHTPSQPATFMCWWERARENREFRAVVCRTLPCLRFIYIAHKFSFHLFSSTVPDVPNQSVRFSIFLSVFALWVKSAFIFRIYIYNHED